MNKAFLIAVLLIAPAIASAQNQTRERRSANPDATVNVGRERVVNGKALNHVDGPKVTPTPDTSADSSRQLQGSSQSIWGNTPALRANETSAGAPQVVASIAPTNSPSQSKILVKPTSLPANQPVNLARTANSVRGAAASIYAVGIGDVLDVRLPNLTTRESTLFTVMKDGTLEYPLVGSPLRVVGMTPDEIAKLLSTQIKVLNSPRVAVSVRDYASHAVVVTGAVGNPGRKILRREAVPLFAVLTESLVRPEATVATITHNGKEGAPISLKDERAMATTVLSGDVIRISGNAGEATKRFIYVGGDVTSPGEKSFREGMTLMQAVLAAGGAQRSTKARVRVSRQDQTGFLTANEYDLGSIDEGKTQDPQLQAGDRIEVIEKM